MTISGADFRDRGYGIWIVRISRDQPAPPLECRRFITEATGKFTRPDSSDLNFVPAFHSARYMETVTRGHNLIEHSRISKRPSGN